MGEGERDLIVAGPLVVHDFYPSWEVRGRPPPPRPPPEFVRIRRRRLVTIEDITHAGALRRLREYCGALIGDDRLCAVGRAHRQRVVEPFFMRADELFVGWAVGYLWDTSDQKGVFVVDPERQALIRTLVPGESWCANVAVGHGSIWITARDRLLRIPAP